MNQAWAKLKASTSEIACFEAWSRTKGAAMKTLALRRALEPERASRVAGPWVCMNQTQLN